MASQTSQSTHSALPVKAGNGPQTRISLLQQLLTIHPLASVAV
jgi:hypothetical protein